jgi:hypothetical protein
VLYHMAILLVAAVAFQLLAGLHGRNASKLRWKTFYGLFVSSGLLAIWLSDVSPALERPLLSLAGASVFALVLTVRSYRHYGKRLRGSVFTVSRRFPWHAFATAPLLILVMFVRYVGVTTFFADYGWLFLGLVAGLWASSLLEFAYVVRLESQLGASIVEDRQGGGG